MHIFKLAKLAVFTFLYPFIELILSTIRVDITLALTLT